MKGKGLHWHCDPGYSKSNQKHVMLPWLRKLGARCGGKLVLDLEEQRPSSTSASSAERWPPYLRRGWGSMHGVNEPACSTSFLLSFQKNHHQGRAGACLSLPLQCPAWCLTWGKCLLTREWMGCCGWIHCWEAGLEADVNGSPNGQRKPKVSKMEFAQGSAMGIRIMMAMIIIMWNYHD